MSRVQSPALAGTVTCPFCDTSLDLAGHLAVLRPPGLASAPAELVLTKPVQHQCAPSSTKLEVVR